MVNNSEVTENDFILIVAVLTLASGIYFRWSDHSKPGKLKCKHPGSYAVQFQENENWMDLTLPLSITTTSGKTLILESMQLKFIDAGVESAPIPWNYTNRHLGRMGNETLEPASPIAFASHENKLIFAIFLTATLEFKPQKRPYHVQLQAVMSNSEEPKTIAEFSLHFENATAQAGNRTYVNFPNPKKSGSK